MNKKALIIVDVQNDFCPGGKLAVKDGDRIIPVINKLQDSGYFDYIVATQDWHPARHISFSSAHGEAPFSVVGSEMTWPDHCIAGTKGAELRPSLDNNKILAIIRKGADQYQDSYSAFKENDGITSTGLDGLLKAKGIEEVYVVGIAYDVCVFKTACDSCNEFNTYVIKDACAAVDTESIKATTKSLKGNYIHIINSKQILEK